MIEYCYWKTGPFKILTVSRGVTWPGHRPAGGSAPSHTHWFLFFYLFIYIYIYSISLSAVLMRPGTRSKHLLTSEEPAGKFRLNFLHVWMTIISITNGFYSSGAKTPSWVRFSGATARISRIWHWWKLNVFLSEQVWVIKHTFCLLHWPKLTRVHQRMNWWAEGEGLLLKTLCSPLTVWVCKDVQTAGFHMCKLRNTLKWPNRTTEPLNQRAASFRPWDPEQSSSRLPSSSLYRLGVFLSTPKGNKKTRPLVLIRLFHI